MYIPTEILTRFPKIELSYEKVLHKKVPADLYILIPKGFKVFVWLTKWQEKNVCLVISKHKDSKETKIFNYPYIYNPDCTLGFVGTNSIGTVLYGTLFDYNNVKHFSCEEICYYKSQNISRERRFDTLKDFFINNPFFIDNTPKKLIIGLPVMTCDLESAFSIANQLPYIIYSIQLYTVNGSNPINAIKSGAYLVKNGMPGSDVSDDAKILPFEIKHAPHIREPIIQLPMPKAYKNDNNNNKEAILKVRASIEDDIYNLYCLEADKVTEKWIGIAMISTYKSSTMMNKLFRKIRENDNLDFLEESEDEEDFENTDINKYVDLEKSVLMKCVYVKRFKKWQPLSVFINDNNDMPIFTYNEIKKREY
jgi:hypothetical protein